MTDDIRCSNFLADNNHVYALKAARKKISIIRIEVTNGDSADLRLLLGSAKLIADGKPYDVAEPRKVIRKLSEFTWDFLIYSLVDFHPIWILLDATLFVAGPLYNRRLRRQLALLSNGELRVNAGESRSALLAFRGVSYDLERLVLCIARGDDGAQEYAFRISPA